MIESGFDPKTYREDPPIGTWRAKLDQAVYAKGTKVGIHVYLTNQTGEKFWFFTRWLGGNPVHTFFKESVQPGDKVEIVVEAGKKSGKPFIKTASKV